MPAGDKYNARLIVSRRVISALESLKVDHPKLTRARRDELRELRAQLAK